MTVKELRDKLNKLMEEMPNTADDEIYYYLNGDIWYINKVDIEWDINWEGRYVCLEE